MVFLLLSFDGGLLLLLFSCLVDSLVEENHIEQVLRDLRQSLVLVDCQGKQLVDEDVAAAAQSLFEVGEGELERGGLEPLG